jgi:hypothetical protein
MEEPERTRQPTKKQFLLLPLLLVELPLLLPPLHLLSMLLR